MHRRCTASPCARVKVTRQRASCGRDARTFPGGRRTRGFHDGATCCMCGEHVTKASSRAVCPCRVRWSRMAVQHKSIEATTLLIKFDSGDNLVDNSKCSMPLVAGGAHSWRHAGRHRWYSPYFVFSGCQGLSQPGQEATTLLISSEQQKRISGCQSGAEPVTTATAVKTIDTKWVMTWK